MKILLLTDSLDSGGMERRLIELLKGLRNYPDLSLYLVIFSERIHYREVFDLGIPVKVLKRVPKRNPLVFFRLFKLCRTWKPDLIHSWGTMSAIIAIPSIFLLKIKLINGSIVNATGNMRFFDKALFRVRLTFPFSKVVVGNSLAGLMAYRVPKKKALCIYNGFDMNRVANLRDISIVRERFGIHTKKVIGMVASFTDRKDFNTYLIAALLILEKRKDVTFIAVGDGPNLAVCKMMIPPQYTSYVVFTGVQTDVESIINGFDIGVLCTNTQLHGEGISNAILEYMALEKPVVATIGGGTNEIVNHKITGVLIPPGLPSVLANELCYLLDNPAIGRQMGQEGKRLVSTSFSMDKMTNTYYKLYGKYF